MRVFMNGDGTEESGNRAVGIGEDGGNGDTTSKEWQREGQGEGGVCTAGGASQITRVTGGTQRGGRRSGFHGHSRHSYLDAAAVLSGEAYQQREMAALPGPRSECETVERHAGWGVWDPGCAGLCHPPSWRCGGGDGERAVPGR